MVDKPDSVILPQISTYAENAGVGPGPASQVDWASPIAAATEKRRTPAAATSTF
jgi:hypothetical protein